MFNRPLCDNSCDRCGAEVTTIFGKDYCSSCKPSVLKAVSNLQSEPTYKRSSRKSQRTELLIREIEGVVDSGSNCDLVNDEFLLHDLQVQSKPIGGVAGTGLSKKRGNHVPLWPVWEVGSPACFANAGTFFMCEQ